MPALHWLDPLLWRQARFASFTADAIALRGDPHADHRVDGPWSLSGFRSPPGLLSGGPPIVGEVWVWRAGLITVDGEGSSFP